MAFGLTLGRPAHAQDEGVAEALYREAQQLIAQGKVHEACVKFAESERIDAATGTLIATAACHEQEGKRATAWVEFTDAVTMAERAKEPVRERYARAHAAALDKSLYRVTIALDAPPSGTLVTLDDRALGVAVLGTAIPLDPGPHRITVTAPHKANWVKDLDVPTSPGDERLVVTLAPAMEAAPAPIRVTPALVVGGTGVAAIVAGSIMLGVAGARGSDARSTSETAGTNAAVYQSAVSERNGALTLQAAGLVVGGMGIAAAAVGTVLFLRARSTGSPHSDAAVFPLVRTATGWAIGATF